MIKTNPTKIEWTDKSWNPIVGCDHGCWYCYAKRMAIRFPKNFPNGFKPTFYPDRFEGGRPLKPGTKVFVCTVADLFAPWTEPVWRDNVLHEIQKPEYDHVIFQLLTKNPENIELKAKSNIWVGATITNQMDVPIAWDLVKNYKGKRFLSFEPILGWIAIQKIFFKHIDWVIIGKLTGSRKVKLDKKWVYSLVNECRELDIPIFLKDNLNWHEKIQEYPI